MGKNENTNKRSELRSNTLPNAEEFLEIVIYEQLRGFPNRNNISFKTQSGFKVKHSYKTSLKVTITEK